MAGVFPTPTLSLITRQVHKPDPIRILHRDIRGGVFAAGLSVPLPRMAAKGKS